MIYLVVVDALRWGVLLLVERGDDCCDGPMGLDELQRRDGGNTLRHAKNNAG